jgi:hypothetical protein
MILILMGFFKGNLDNLFKDKNGSDQPSIYFNATFRNIYEDVNDLIANSKLAARGRKDNEMYILISPYSKEKIRKLASEGKFSEAIKEALDYPSVLNYREKISQFQNSVDEDDPSFKNIIPRIISNDIFGEKQSNRPTQ